MSAPILRLAAWAASALPEPLRLYIYRTGPFAGWLRALLTGAATEELTEVRIAAGPLAGARLRLDLTREKTLWLGNYEPELMRAIKRFGRHGMLAYDVGGNLGYVSLALARRAGPEGSVVAFEPLPANLERLQANLRLNPEGTRVRVVAAAVGDRDALADFLVHPSAGMGKLAGSAGRAAEYQARITVPQIALDAWSEADGAQPDLVKIDVEGGEADALRGMQRLLRSARPVLLIELHGPSATEQALAALERADYRLHHMRAGFPLFEPSQDWKHYVVGLPAEGPQL